MGELHSLAYTSSSSLQNSSLGWDFHHSLGVLNYSDTMSLGTPQYFSFSPLFHCCCLFVFFLHTPLVVLLLLLQQYMVSSMNAYIPSFKICTQLWMAMHHCSHLWILISLPGILKMLWSNSLSAQNGGV